MKSLRNSVTIIGNLGQDPELKNVGGTAKTTLSVATNESYKNSKGERVENTQWHNVILWGKLADVAAKYLKKGSEVAIEGSIQYRNYETSTGEKRYVTEIRANEMQLLSSKEAA